jgi:hypothetical protein
MAKKMARTRSENSPTASDSTRLRPSAPATPTASASHVRIRGAAFYDDVRLQLIGEQRFIPIEAFAYWLKRGDLRVWRDPVFTGRPAKIARSEVEALAAKRVSP